MLKSSHVAARAVTSMRARRAIKVAAARAALLLVQSEVLSRWGPGAVVVVR